jgi:hypothetical protein
VVYEKGETYIEGSLYTVCDKKIAFLPSFLLYSFLFLISHTIGPADLLRSFSSTTFQNIPGISDLKLKQPVTGLEWPRGF